MMTDSASSEGEENHRDILDSKEGFLLSAAQALDWICLSLGVLTNLAQVLEEAKTIFRETSEQFYEQFYLLLRIV